MFVFSLEKKSFDVILINDLIPFSQLSCKGLN